MGQWAREHPLVMDSFAATGCIRGGKENGKAGLGLIHPFLAVRTGPNDLTSFSISFLGGHWEE